MRAFTVLANRKDLSVQYELVFVGVFETLQLIAAAFGPVANVAFTFKFSEDSLPAWIPECIEDAMPPKAARMIMGPYFDVVNPAQSGPPLLFIDFIRRHVRCRQESFAYRSWTALIRRHLRSQEQWARRRPWSDERVSRPDAADMANNLDNLDLCF